MFIKKKKKKRPLTPNHSSLFKILQKLQSLLNIQENYSTCKTFLPFFINPFLSSLNKETEKPSLFALPLLSCTLIEFVWVVDHRHWVAWVAACRFVGRATAPSQGRGRLLMVAWLGSCNDSAGSHQCLGSFFFWLGWWRCSGWVIRNWVFLSWLSCFFVGWKKII